MDTKNGREIATPWIVVDETSGVAGRWTLKSTSSSDETSVQENLLVIELGPNMTVGPPVMVEVSIDRTRGTVKISDVKSAQTAPPSAPVVSNRRRLISQMLGGEYNLQRDRIRKRLRHWPGLTK